jgi:hypothetical protein
MYLPRNPDYRKSDPEMRWALPDRVFFACGACHILAYAFLKRWGRGEMRAVWIKPDAGHIGNHIYVEARDWVFDYHGYSETAMFLTHTWRRARQRWPGWGATRIPLPTDVLVSRAKSLTYQGLSLREPSQFLHDATPRAKAYLDRFPAPPK